MLLKSFFFEKEFSPRLEIMIFSDRRGKLYGNSIHVNTWKLCFREDFLIKKSA